MSEAENITIMVGILKRVPEKTLKLIELTREMTTSKGELDVVQVVNRQQEVNLAVQEAKGYAQATESAVAALMKLRPRAGGNP